MLSNTEVTIVMYILLFYNLLNNLICKDKNFVQKQNGECRKRSLKGCHFFIVDLTTYLNLNT